jgi:hypothetical protein
MAGSVKATIEVTDLEFIRGGVPLLRTCLNAVEALLEGGGTAETMYIEDRHVQQHFYDGPDELVREVVTALMTFKLAAAVEKNRPIIAAGIADDLFRPNPLMRLTDE